MEKKENEMEKCEKNVNLPSALITYFRKKMKVHFILIR